MPNGPLFGQLDALYHRMPPFTNPSDALKTVAGIGPVNQGHRQMSTPGLEKRQPQLQYAFSITCSWYNTLKEQGDKDSLTGLQNRNRYERTFRSSGRFTGIRFTYVDVQRPARAEQYRRPRSRRPDAVPWRTSCSNVSANNTYRIGGDEFLVFSPDIEKKRWSAFAGATDTLERGKIHVSVGVEWITGDFSITDLIKTAEKKDVCGKKGPSIQTMPRTADSRGESREIRRTEVQSAGGFSVPPALLSIREKVPFIAQSQWDSNPCLDGCYWDPSPRLFVQSSRLPRKAGRRSSGGKPEPEAPFPAPELLGTGQNPPFFRLQKSGKRFHPAFVTPCLQIGNRPKVKAADLYNPLRISPFLSWIRLWAHR